MTKQVKNFTMELKGLKRFEKLMQKMGRAFTRREQISALKFALKPVRDQMRENIPRNKTGNLWTSIAVSEDPSSSKFASVGGFPVIQVGAIVGSRRKKGAFGQQGWSSHLLEWGAKPHTITAREGKMIPIKGGFAKSVQHPGIRGKKIFTKAINQSLFEVEGRLLTKYQAIMAKSMNV